MIMSDRAKRRKEFRIALINAGVLVSQFAADNAVSEGHLHAYLRGERKSAPLDAAIDTFIAEHAPTSAAA